MTTKIAVYREAARLIQDMRLATLTDDIPGRYAFDDAFDHVVEFVLRSAYWKFALKTVTPDTSAVDPLPGFTFVYDLPCDWIRTHALFILPASSALECPFDCRHQLEQVHCKVGDGTGTDPGPIYLRYISNDYADPETWPENFAHAVACRLAFDCAKRITGNPAEMEQLEGKWQTAYQMALMPDALLENDWLRFQLNGTLYVCTKWLLDEALWRFAIKTITLDSERGFELLTNGNFIIDSDWTKGTGWTIVSGIARKAAGSSSSLTQAVAFTVGADYEVTFEVSNYVAGTVTAQFTGGSTVSGTARSADGEYTETLTAVTSNATFGLLASAAGNFRVKIVSVKEVLEPAIASSGYAYAFDKPDDWGRTVYLYRGDNISQWTDIDFRDEGGRIHADFDDLTLRYISTDGEIGTTWSDGFRKALLAYLQYEEAKANPQTAGAVLQARAMVFKDSLKNARLKDDMQERPRFNDVGQLVSARMGGTGRFGRTREQGIWG